MPHQLLHPRLEAHAVIVALSANVRNGSKADTRRRALTPAILAAHILPAPASLIAAFGRSQLEKPPAVMQSAAQKRHMLP